MNKPKKSKKKGVTKMNDKNNEKVKETIEKEINNTLPKKEEKKEENTKVVETNKQKETKDTQTPKKEEKVEVKNEVKNETDVKTNNINAKTYFSYENRILLNVVIIFILFVVALISFVVSLKVETKSNITYKQTSNLDYKVYLKENDYYKQPYLGRNMQYIASLIDYIDVDFNYNFSANARLNYTYAYYVKADVLVADGEDESKVIYSTTDKIKDTKLENKTNSDSFEINENVKIDYQKYNDMIKAFKSSYGISANSKLTLTLCMEVRDEKGSIIKSMNADNMKVTIPLTEQMVNVSLDYKEVNNSNNVAVHNNLVVSNKVTIILSVISLLLMFIAIVKLVLFFIKTRTKKTIYDITVSRILREYDRVIVNSKNPIELTDEIVDVNSFNELLDVRDNLEKPIIYNEIHKGQKSLFVVKGDGVTYRYIIKLVDLEEEKNKKK